MQTDGKKARTANRRLAQWRVKWLIGHSASHQILCCIDSFVLRNPLLQTPATLVAIHLNIIKFDNEYIRQNQENAEIKI